MLRKEKNAAAFEAIHPVSSYNNRDCRMLSEREYSLPRICASETCKAGPIPSKEALIDSNFSK